MFSGQCHASARNVPRARSIDASVPFLSTAGTVPSRDTYPVSCVACRSWEKPTDTVSPTDAPLTETVMVVCAPGSRRGGSHVAVPEMCLLTAVPEPNCNCPAPAVFHDGT